MSFSIIEGSVDVKVNLLRASGAIYTDSSLTQTVSFAKSAKLIRVAVRCREAALPFTIKIYSNVAASWEYTEFQADSNGDQEIDVSGLDIPVVSVNGNLYVNVSHAAGVSRTFDLVIQAEKAK